MLSLVVPADSQRLQHRVRNTQEEAVLVRERNEGRRKDRGQNPEDQSDPDPEGTFEGHFCS